MQKKTNEIDSKGYIGAMRIYICGPTNAENYNEKILQ